MTLKLEKSQIYTKSIKIATRTTFLAGYVFDFHMNVILNYYRFFCVIQSLFPVKEVPVKQKQSLHELRHGALPGARGHTDLPSTKIYF